MAIERQYTAGSIGLELDGEFVGFLASASGGEPYTVAVAEPAGGDAIVHKHIGETQYEPIVIEVGLDMDPVFFTWLQDALSGSGKPHDGRIRFFDYTMKERDSLDFAGAVLTAVTLPKLDAASKAVARLSLTLTPAKTGHGSSPGKKPALSKKTTKLLAANFTVDIDGLHSASAFVKSVDPITITCVPAVDVSLITLTVAAAHAADFRKWFDTFVLGANRGSDERKGQIDLRDPSLKRSLLTIELGHLGILRVSEANLVASSDTIVRVAVQMYCETVRLTQATDKQNNPPVRRLAGTGGSVSDIADRLMATATPVAPPRLGAMWAEGTASLDELSAVAALDGQEWDAVTLDDDHSLLSTLRDAGVVAGGAGSVVLERDPEIDQVISDAADVYRKVLSTLSERMTETASAITANLK